MVRLALLVVLFSGAQADVPLGECHGCEVTCFEDCALKYDREIIQPDSFLQLDKVNHTQKLTSEYTECLMEDKCPCKKEEAKAALTRTALVQKNTTKCAVGDVPCAQKCGQKVMDKQPKAAVKKPSFVQKIMDYPIHSVAIGTFSKGAMNLDECLKFCLAATCGCDNAPGLDKIDKLFNAIKANDAKKEGGGGAVVDTPKAAQYRPSKIEECAKGMPGKKVTKGRYVQFSNGYLEVGTPEFFAKVLGPGDHSAVATRWASTKSDDEYFGCKWDGQKEACFAGADPFRAKSVDGKEAFAQGKNLKCLIKYTDDPTL